MQKLTQPVSFWFFKWQIGTLKYFSKMFWCKQVLFLANIFQTFLLVGRNSCHGCVSKNTNAVDLCTLLLTPWFSSTQDVSVNESKSCLCTKIILWCDWYNVFTSQYFPFYIGLFLEKRKLFRKYKTCLRELKECSENEERFVSLSPHYL